ncbi:polyketide synthase alb1 [Aspergillus clavatus NRRL 1]|uniref:Polyketide synthetase PksP n=1 Tax=Aspergillus clavatus (strain ATCC 1007 / CBS 513.65 / DSM 816 / NCTC 3887 / NRRL 1 / QM 1276 / 107) TaxID=344612 RepID=A1C888_ASPCL|nr:polyketide synthetase PksP [Aspergillus clavatus NRRL 1]EAW14609.1 polyketide synthetase PksP [Aspergillus clavatus NRRL 1]
MMEDLRRVYLFGDQTISCDEGLRNLLQAKNHTIVASFFERCFHALRREISKLPPSQRSLFPRFTSIADLLARHRESGTNPALGSALTCIHQLGCFIDYHGDRGHPYPSAEDSLLLGSCTGLLSCAAVSSCRNVGELLPLAVEVVAMAIHLGLCVMTVRDLVDSSSSSTGSWSVLVSDLNEEDAINRIAQFHEKRGINPSSRPYISAVGSKGLTISAPPEILDEFIEEALPKECKHFKAPGVHGPYHAPHLYNEREIQSMLDSCSDMISNYAPHISLLSSNTGKTVQAQSTRDLLKVALEEILVRRICWDKVTESCLSIVQSTPGKLWKILPIASSATQGLATALQRVGNCRVEVDTGVGAPQMDPAALNQTGNTSRSKIAIIGMSGRFPEADGVEAFWDLLYKGLDVHKTVPPDRWDVDAHVDLTGTKRNTSKVPFGCWINEPGMFDARFFNMSPREALQADPAQRLALLTAYEALEMAGFIPNSTPSTQRDRVGIFYGMTSDDYREINSGQDIDTYFIPGGNRAFTPGRINYYFKFSGPSVSVDTACSSSLAAIHLACNAIWRNDCDSAITGGVNLLTNPDNHAGLDRGHFLSRTGNCNTFDDGADGYCRADGVGSIVLKRLEDAEADNDPILGVINAAYTNHSAEAVSITRPHVGAQAFIFNKLLNDTNTNPHEVSYVEMHGTGTQAGDAVEMQSVLDVFAPDCRRGPANSLHLGSAKSNVGHGESASGVTSLVKVLLMMKQNMIPPHCGIKTKINHNFPTDLAQRNVHIALKPTPWTRPVSGKRKMFLNNFSAAGGNTALLLEDSPLREITGQDPRNVHVVSVTARSQSALKRNINALIKYIDTHAPSAPANEKRFLASLAYTTTARRIHHPFRATAVGATVKDIRDALRQRADQESTTPVPATAPKVGFVFTGQGAQYSGMGKQLYEDCATFRSIIHRFDCIARSQGFPSIIHLIDGSVPVEGLSPVVTQLGTTCLQMALVDYWRGLGVSPAFVLGHSLGDYAALNAAGVLSTSDTIYLCGRRAQLLTEQCQMGTHAMLAVKAALSDIQHLLDAEAHAVACINGPTETVISGLSGHIDELAEQLTGQSLKSTKLKVPFAFHSAQVTPILDPFEDKAQGVVFHKPSVPFVSALTGEVITEENYEVLGPRYMVKHCRETVNFLGGLEATRHAKLMNETTVWLEVGSHPICSGMIKSTFGPQATTVASLRRDEDPWKIISNSLSTLHLAGVELNWKQFHQGFDSAHEVLNLPRYSWDLKNYWIPYTNNFCLTKGAPVAAEASAPKSTFLTTAAQKIVENRDDGTMATLVVENNIADPDLNRVIQGHKVNGVALTPSSLYADIAQTLVDHLITTYKPELQGLGLDVCDMTVPKPLIAKSGDQFFRISAVMNWADKKAAVQVYSVNAEGKKMIEHANCTVKLFDCADREMEWKRISYLVKRSVSLLQDKAQTGEAHRMQRGMVYKLFAALVDYDENFKSIQEVVLDSKQHEATAKVKFQAPAGNFHRNPFWIDSFGHLSGFIMNASDATDSKNQVFVNHGWDSMRCLKKFSADATYQTYVKMQPWRDSIWAGDVYVFEGDDIIAVYGGVKFQALARKILDTVLPPVGAAKAASAPIQTTPQKLTPAPIKVKAPPKVARSNKPDSAASRVVARALEILAAEVGLSESEMTDGLNFADYGVDSLLSLTVTGRYREELNLDFESSVFMDYPTIKDFKAYLAEKGFADVSSPEPCSEPESKYSFNSDASSEASSGLTSPGIASPVKEDVVSPGDSKVWSSICSILAEEIGVAVGDIDPNDNLPEMGMDSLLSLTVLGRIRETLDMDLPAEFFLENPTLDAIQVTLDLKPKAAPQATRAPERIQLPEIITNKKLKTTQHPPATSILLQGNPRTATSKLFLFPDGSGSASSYATIPALSPDICVYGLNCPYMKTPQNLKCSLEELTEPYLAEIRRRQPTGPYNFGGWSAGGICAFDAARQLILEEGEVVERLLLLDSPFPIGLEKLPPRLYGFFNSIGLFGDGKRAPPDWLLPHFLAFIDSLDAYKAVPLPFTESAWADKMPQTYLIWAKDGVCGKPGDPRPEPPADGSKDPREMQWLLNDRTDLGPNKWDTLVGSENIGGIHVMEQANHFTMTTGEKAKELSAFMAQAMSS